VEPPIAYVTSTSPIFVPELKGDSWAVGVVPQHLQSLIGLFRAW
jgi:hypothetical protein